VYDDHDIAMSRQDLVRFRAAHARLIARLYAQSGAGVWGLQQEAFLDALHRSVAHGCPEGASRSEVARYLASLHVGDLALACACRAGEGAAWDHLVLEVRPALYTAARSVAGDGYRELADSLYAELYGVSTAGQQRTSLLAWFHGRSRLVTWLRSVLVQRHIDARRAASRLEQWDGDEDRAPLPSMSGPGTVPDPGRSEALVAIQVALDAAIAGLDARDRLRLRLYYGEDLTLAQIGRVTGEHEATVSRKLERARKALRTLVEVHLRQAHGLSDQAIAECFAQAADAPELHLTRLLSRAEDG
jgi:RNA polymerase sigma-70 factor (ECF subfamily)